MVRPEFRALAFTVAVAVASLSVSCVVTGDAGSAMVRYTWEDSQVRRGYIQEIIAGYEDVRYWRDYVYPVLNVYEDASDDPLYGGSYDIRDKIYSSDLPYYANRYKGVYMSISPGNYTAVCKVYDIGLNNTYYIVANYKISVGGPGTVMYYEVAFDVRAFLDGNDDLGWEFGNYGEDPKDDDPMLEKAVGAEFVGRLEKGGVTYYAFRERG